MSSASKTLSGLDLRFLSQMPLPLAERAAQLHAARANYIDELISLTEDAVTLANAVALARLARQETRARSRAAELLRRPAFGSRIDLLWLLDSIEAGSTGWDPDDSAEGTRPLIAKINPQSTPRHPKTRHVLAAINKLRNDKDHRRLAPELRLDVARELEAAVFELIRTNSVFNQQMLWLDEVRKTTTGFEATSMSLNGLAMSRYRLGRWQPVPEDAQPRHVVLGEPTACEDLHPFVVRTDDGRVWVLDEVRSRGAVLRHFLSRSELDPGSSILERWPEPGDRAADDTYLDPTPPVDAAPTVWTGPTHDRARPGSPRPTSVIGALFKLVGIGCAATMLIFVLLACFGIATWSSTGEPEETAPTSP